jgi:hypothetical protein
MKNTFYYSNNLLKVHQKSQTVFSVFKNGKFKNSHKFQISCNFPFGAFWESFRVFLRIVLFFGKTLKFGNFFIFEHLKK